MRLIAHRGGRGFGTDNTVEAMENAVRAGVRWIETDVRATGDGRLALCHDATIWGRNVGRITYEELKRHSPERPLLDDLLESLAGWVSFNIEIKEAPAASVGRVLAEHGIVDDVIVTSFDKDIVADFKREFPQSTTGLLFRMPYGRDRKLDRALDMGASLIAPYYNSIDEELVGEAHDRGLAVYAWTVNDEGDFRKLHSWGVDAIITDRYMRLKELAGSVEAEQRRESGTGEAELR